ncbi:MAG: flavin reductase [Bauldia sp.]|nr:flavin reductase [Bauldia sp.]
MDVMSTALARIPAGPIDPTPDEFRIAMRNLSAGVSIVATGYGKAKAGMTVTSVSSLSIDPPCVLVCLGLSSGTLAALRENGSFGVSILAENQQSIAERFSGRAGIHGAAKFVGSHWTTGVTGAPLAVGALSAIDCTLESLVEWHSHAIVVGQVRSVHVNEAAAPLVYWRGDYRNIEAED